jgi:hypothetical protein
MFGGCVFQQTAVQASLLTDLFLYSYEANFIQGIESDSQKKKKTKLARSFNVTFRYIDPLFSLNHSRCSDFVHRIYPIELT